jgi:hypothetical protein
MPAPDGGFDTKGDRQFLLGHYAGIDWAAGVTIDGAATHVLGTQWDAGIFQSDGGDWFILASH